MNDIRTHRVPQRVNLIHVAVPRQDQTGQIEGAAPFLVTDDLSHESGANAHPGATVANILFTSVNHRSIVVSISAMPPSRSRAKGV